MEQIPGTWASSLIPWTQNISMFFVWSFFSFIFHYWLSTWLYLTISIIILENRKILHKVWQINKWKIFFILSFLRNWHWFAIGTSRRHLLSGRHGHGLSLNSLLLDFSPPFVCRSFRRGLPGSQKNWLSGANAWYLAKHHPDPAADWSASGNSNKLSRHVWTNQNHQQ